MKKIGTVFFLISMFLTVAMNSLGAAEPAVAIRLESTALLVGETVPLRVVFIDTAGSETDTTATWKIRPAYLGDITGDTALTAESAGTGKLYATLGLLTDSVDVEFTSDEPVTLSEPYLVIKPQNVSVEIGDTIVFRLFYYDTLGEKYDTSGVWSLIPDSLGTIDQNGRFIADYPGECLLSAELDTLSATSGIFIFPEEDDDGAEQNGFYAVSPGDTLVQLGDNMQFSVVMCDTDSVIIVVPDSLIEWSLTGMDVGTLSSTGLLETDAPGFGIVTATLDNFEYSALVIVTDTAYDASGINSVTVTRSTPNPAGYAVMAEISEGSIWRIGGLPYPMNVLNDGIVYFPYGSLKEDIRIHMELPGFANPDSGGVSYTNHETVTAVQFQVFVNDTLKEPYYFEKPLYAGLVYKRGLLANLGIDPATLALYFAVEAGDSLDFVSDGIEYVTLDENLNRIFSTVAHFSTLAVKGDAGTTAIDNPDDEVVARDFKLHQNYPNPFNPTTTIAYELAARSDVQLIVYNILGQEIRALVSQNQKPGFRSVIWDGKNADGINVPTGVYIYRITAGNFSEARKMILLK